MEWLDPELTIWGFHCHQELPEKQFPEALVIQRHCEQYLREHSIETTSAAFLPGYGPHILHMWEVRVETAQSDVLQKLGTALSFLTVNRFGLSGHIHPLMHNADLEDDLEIEGRLNQPNALWFSYKVEQNQEFFFHPPRDEQLRLVDTRMPRILSAEQKNEYMSLARTLAFRDPFDVIIDGFDICLEFAEFEKTNGDRKAAIEIGNAYISYLTGIGLTPVRTKIYESGQGTSFVNGGWEVRLGGENSNILTDIGPAIGWLMCNRQGHNVLVQPRLAPSNVASEEFTSAEHGLSALPEYSSFMGLMPTRRIEALGALGVQGTDAY